MTEKKRLSMKHGMRKCIVLSLLFALLCFHDSAALSAASAGQSLGSEKPEHLVLTWQGDAKTTQSFTWRTSPDIQDTQVQLVPTSEFTGFPDEDAIFVNGTSFLFTTDIGTMSVHEAEVKGLTPGTSYTYRVGDGHDGRWSEPASFITEPAEQATFTFLFTSDTQAYPNGSATNGYGIWGEILTKGIEAFPDARFMLLSGDIVDYGDQQQQWELWFDAAKEKLPSLPIVPTVGNHDAVRSGEANFRAQFQLPRNGPAGEEELAYSFDYGNMHMAVLNSEGNLDIQAEWLKADMASSSKPWKIVAFHRSPYHSHESRANKDIRQAWTPALDAAGVDLVLSGHDHAYMRSYPMKDGRIVEDGSGTTYIIGGTAGSKFYEMGNHPWIRVAFDDDVQMFSGITVEDDRLRMHVVTRNGEVVDAFTMMKDGGTADDFLDMPVTHWAYSAIMSLKDQGIVQGISDRTFAPDQPVTRAEFVSLLARTLDLPPSQTASEYVDVKPEDWFYHEVNRAVQFGITQGVNEHMFAPNRWMTRQEMAALIVRAYEYRSGNEIPADHQLAGFSDQEQAADWAVESINKALTAGLMSGLPNRRFAPEQLASRVEAAQVIVRIMERD